MAALASTLSHGTVECKDLAETRRFYEDFLGLKVIQPVSMAIYAEGGGDWRLVCVRSGIKLKEQGIENRFCLHVGNRSAVVDGHAAAVRDQEHYAIRAVLPLVDDGGYQSFSLQDRDNVWWEISDRPQRPVLGRAQTRPASTYPP